MYRTLLINKLDMDDMSDDIHCIVVQIGAMSEKEELISDVLHSIRPLIGYKKITYCNNGIKVDMPVKHIPLLVAELVKSDFAIFGVYERYTP